MLIALGGVGLVLVFALTVIVGLALKVRRQRRARADFEAPGIVVYPSQQGDGPQFW